MSTIQNIICIELGIVKLLSQNKLAIFLDIDGTLIPHANHPNNIIVPKNLKFLLYNLRNKLNGALALISGRMVKDIQNIINPLKLSVSGIHGLEYTNELGKYLINDMEPIPLYIYEKLFKFSKNYPGSFIEKKNISVALHYRNAPGMEKKAINFKFFKNNHNNIISMNLINSTILSSQSVFFLVALILSIIIEFIVKLSVRNSLYSFGVYTKNLVWTEGRK